MDSKEIYGNNEESAQVSNNQSSEKNPGVKHFLKNPEYRNRVMHTMYLAVTFVALGLFVGQIGPTFLDLQIITGTDLEKASAFFTGGSIGYLTGSVTAGAIYSRVNKNLLMFIGTLFMGISTAVTAYCKPYALMIFIRIACGATGGFVDTVGNSEQMRMWGNEGQGLMQLLHAAFAFGGVISPLYTAPFLAQRVDENNQTFLTNENEHSVMNYSNSSSVLITNFTSLITEGNFTNGTSVSQKGEDRGTNVHFAFLITGIFAVLSGVPFLIFFVSDKIKHKIVNEKTNVKVTQRKLPLPVFLFILANLCAFYILYCCVEDTFASFLSTFLVREYSVSKPKAAYITAIYWASFATSRFLMIFMTKVFSAVRLLYLCCTLMIIAFTSFIISAVYGSVVALSVFAAMAGLSMSAVFPSGFLWTETELLRVTGPISSCILMSASLGTMVNPIILSYLMEEFTNMWFCYLLVGETIMVSAVFVFLLIFNRRFVNKRYGALKPAVIESTITVEENESKLPLNERSTENGNV